MYKLYMSCLLTLGLLATGHVPSHAESSEIIVGVLEHHKGLVLEYHKELVTGDPFYFTVRVMFKKTEGEWQSFESDCSNRTCLKALVSEFPPRMKWTITFDGKNLGQVPTVSPGEFKNIASVGQQDIVRGSKIPTIGKPSQEFNGWVLEDVYRPLVAVSRPYYKDPDHWKLSHHENKLIQLARAEFRKQFPAVTNCDKEDPSRSQPWPYADSDIKILKSYSSNKHWTLLQLSLEGQQCEVLDDNSPFMGQWFTVSPEQDVSHLGEAMMLIDAGDYDNDGRSEVMFKTHGYNRGGYKLFYKDFTESVSFQFGFH